MARASIVALAGVLAVTAGTAGAQWPERAVKVKATKIAGGPWVEQSADGQWAFLYGRKGGVLHGPVGKPRKLALAGLPYRIAVAPGGAQIAYVAEADAKVRVIDVKTGAVWWERGFGGRYERMNVAFRDERTLVVSTGCRVLRFDLEEPDEAPDPIGARLCDEGKDVASGDDQDAGARMWYRRGTSTAAPSVLDVATGKEHAVPWTREADVAVAHDGSLVCAGFRYQRRADVLCARPGKRPAVAIAGVPRGIDVDPAGGRVAALIAVEGETSELVIVDVTTGVTTRLGKTAHESVAFVGRDVATSGRAKLGATLWRLDAGERTTFFAGKEVEHVRATSEARTLLAPVARGAGEVFHLVRFEPTAPQPWTRPAR